MSPFLRESGGHLGHALAALGNDQELDDGNDEVDDEADHHIAGDHELAKSANDLAGVALHQNHPAGRDR
jgi:hypothetical protein